MFRKLKLKFIGISTLSMVIVLFIVLGLVNIITYKNVIDGIFSTLDFISEHSENDGTLKADEIKSYKGDMITPETQYESRYFTVLLDKNEVIISYNNEHIAMIRDRDEVERVVSNVTDLERERGLFTYEGLNYAYLKKYNDKEKNIKVTIMDCTRSIKAAQFFVKFSVYIGFLSVLLLIFLLSVFARKVVNPYVKNAEAQKQFITNASHELKTPLAVISANTEVIEMMGGKNEWTESTINQVNRLTNLISQLVVLSRLEEREDLVLTDVNMSEEVSNVIKDFKAVVDTQGKKMEYSVAENIHVKADEKGIHELANILVDNAVKYCDDEGTIKITLSQKGKSACLTVSNDYKDGTKIDCKRFFDRFYREDQSHNSENQGYGIGLSMADSLVRMFKGKINVTYKKPVITFTVTL
ncbi:MAG: HAMP domain-containing histidine kinase [Eubacterium sp.]|nr:HAMP domain-containing histidine kinase [Eubacterium sp.]